MTINEMQNFEDIFSYEHLYQSYLLCRKGITWKEGVQKFQSQTGVNIYKIWEQLNNGKWKHKGYYQFHKLERGKDRLIQSEYFTDRIVQRCFCEYSLVPLLTKSLIYDNSASQKGKGVDFAIKRCKKHLDGHIRKYGNNGYILQFDFHHYFASIPHDKVFQMLRKIYTDERVLKIVFSMIDSFDEGLGLGSQVSQTLALYYPNRLDHKVKEYYHIKGYGRHMDDGYAISNSKEELLEILDCLKKWCDEFGITLNSNKTHIRRLSKGFTFLKRKFIILPNKIIITINKKNLVRTKRKLKYFVKAGWTYHKMITYCKGYWSNMTYQKCKCFRQAESLRKYIVNNLKPLKVERKDEELLARIINEINQLATSNTA